MRHILHHWAQAAPLSLETAGGPCSANSAAPKGCMGQGMGSMPMSTDAQPVPSMWPVSFAPPRKGSLPEWAKTGTGLVAKP